MPDRRRVIAGNWKMNIGPSASRGFFDRFELPAELDSRVILFPPALSFTAARVAPTRDPRIELGVQNVHWEDSGAFTGEISVAMAAEAGAGLVLVGHSERRHVFGETDEQVGWKVATVLRHRLTPVLCVGETLEERRSGRLEPVLVDQVEAALGMVESGAPLIVAYEPVWAIGTGETATPDDASRAHAFLRTRLAGRLGSGAAAEVPILYGGSVKPENAADLLAADEVDGVLVGGASLDPHAFARIVRAS